MRGFPQPAQPWLWAIIVIALALMFAMVGCSGETLPERGCQRFAELMDDVALSVNQPQRLLDAVSGESVSIMIDSPEFQRRPGESEAEQSTRFALSTGKSAVIIALESMAMYAFHDDYALSRPAYQLWKSAAVVGSGAPQSRDHLDTWVYANILAEKCEARGYQVSEAEPGVIVEYLKK